ncbi:hypothetical protein A1O3_05226 [Capronia epimyces CBS 606.96]|uniref:Xylanolytic transcriptional activator regulatory domain-containing protein n=1 Tax=Capronia epimyces CBS 606.96 TaxID=1182542 RepID=W9XVG9_9EURO|nr:uncharacterized protein A1O3_05226 [Capronia epimyces CBS 606.96]EXJ84557.1 hypothetical protein A1O3_05226 [Capronia epimyces CBS 606.96]
MSMRTDDSSAIAAKSTQATTTTELESSESLITRLCGAQGRLNSKHDGQLRYFGPTSSLHLTESVNSIFRYCSDIQRFGAGFEKDVPWAMQQYLLDLYWRYQHDILHIVHKQAFLAGMEATHSPSPYFSRCLLLCILASAARSSASPEIRALTLPAEEDTGESPILMKQAEEALQEELLNPGLTTVQSLMLLSILDCCQSNDSRGWMRSGQACRLAFDLGLHQNWSHLPQSKLPSFEMEVRRVIFWGCVGFDRLWALYLGRPPVIKLSDVSIPRPDRNASSWEMKMFAAWVELLDLAGQISEKLNTNTCFQEQIDFYMDALQSWDSSCDHSITFFPNAPPGVYLLRIQYSALVILLNRHNAGYGNLQKRNCAHSQKSRKACVEHALITSQLLQDYAAHHGSANTMMGSVLYNITSAATIVVAEMAEKNRRDVPKESAALAICLNAMKEMESAEIVARNVRKIVQTIMRVCNVQNNYSYDDGNAGAGAGAGPVTGFWAKDYNPSNEDGPSHAGVDEATTADANKENDRNNTNTNTNTNTNNNNNNTATTTTTNATTTTINDAMSLNFGPLGFDSVFQFPFEEVLLDPMSANEFMQQ